jgi:hypothetical protein
MRTPPRTRFRTQPSVPARDNPAETPRPHTPPRPAADAAHTDAAHTEAVSAPRARQPRVLVDRRRLLGGAGLAGLAAGALGFADAETAAEPPSAPRGDGEDPRRLQAPDTEHTRSYFARARF